MMSPTPNYTMTYLAEHVDISHDQINRLLKNSSFRPRKVKKRCSIENKKIGVLDDSVLNKKYSKKIELAHKMWNNCDKKVVMGIGLVSLTAVNEENKEFDLYDYRIYDKPSDDKTKTKHAMEMLANSNFDKYTMDTWYTSREIMLHLHSRKKKFYGFIRNNRIFFDIHNQKHSLTDYQWSEDELQHGKPVTLMRMRECPVILFKKVSNKGDIDYIVTNNLEEDSLEEVEKLISLRWKIEEYHREIKQLTGIESCQARKSRIQRNHIALCLMSWQCLKKEAMKQKVTIYNLWKSQMDIFIREYLRIPPINFA